MRTRYSNLRVRGMHTVPGDNARIYFSKKGVNVHFGAWNRYILKLSTNHTPGALRLASLASYLFLVWKGQVHLLLNTLCSFLLFLADFEPISGHTLVPPIDTWYICITNILRVSADSEAGQFTLHSKQYTSQTPSAPRQPEIFYTWESLMR